MTRSEIAVKTLKDAGITKVPREKAIPLMRPYYCSWYTCAFSGPGVRTDAEQSKSAREAQ